MCPSFIDPLLKICSSYCMLAEKSLQLSVTEEKKHLENPILLFHHAVHKKKRTACQRAAFVCDVGCIVVVAMTLCSLDCSFSNNSGVDWAFKREDDMKGSCNFTHTVPTYSIAPLFTEMFMVQGMSPHHHFGISKWQQFATLACYTWRISWILMIRVTTVMKFLQKL